ncbi:hypothetical protein [Mesorhizobium sp. M0816]|uniref:hypothetical protein n=1 Tax=Mesorhizobium sp. M0816 TaxID=2957006 RepID=UPI00333CF29E
MDVSRGSEWHRWEPHTHAPGTVLEDRFPAGGWEQYLTVLESAVPKLRAIGVTDYCVTRSYERVRAHKQSGRLPDCDLLFPNIELRLNTGTVKGNFVNIHLLACPDDPNHITELNRFLAQLVFGAFSDKFACTPSILSAAAAALIRPRPTTRMRFGMAAPSSRSRSTISSIPIAA